MLHYRKITYTIMCTCYEGVLITTRLYGITPVIHAQYYLCTEYHSDKSDISNLITHLSSILRFLFSTLKFVTHLVSHLISTVFFSLASPPKFVFSPTCEQHTLTITGVNSFDNGLYTCAVLGDTGAEVTPGKITLTVLRSKSI